MAGVLESIKAEYLRYRALAEGAMAQLTDAELSADGPNGGNSIAVICWHLSGNFASRFTDFLTSDGEKPWRQRESEFEPRATTREELQARWNGGWAILLDALAPLTDADLTRTVLLRGQPFLVHEALLRSLAHVAYHTGQIVYLAKAQRGTAWQYLSIPPGQSEAYNRDPSRDRASSHSAALGGPSAGGGS
ncbi:MAG: DUF1572 family protein [Vicinamibacterales bacterium]